MFKGKHDEVPYRFVDVSLFQVLRDLNTFRNEWTLDAAHSQTLGNKFDFTSDLRFVSSDAAPGTVNRIDDVADVVDRRIESRVTLRKTWDIIGFSASARRVQVLNLPDPSENPDTDGRALFLPLEPCAMCLCSKASCFQ